MEHYVAERKAVPITDLSIDKSVNKDEFKRIIKDWFKKAYMCFPKAFTGDLSHYEWEHLIKGDVVYLTPNYFLQKDPILEDFVLFKFDFVVSKV